MAAKMLQAIQEGGVMIRVKIRTWHGQMEDEIGLLIDPIKNSDSWDWCATLNDRQMVKVERAIRKAFAVSAASAEAIRRRWQIQTQPPCGPWTLAVLNDNTLTW